MSTFTVSIHENTTEPVGQGDQLCGVSQLGARAVYSQTFPSLDAGKLIAFLNQPARAKRIYKGRVKTEAKST